MRAGVEIGKMVAVKSAGWGGDREDGGGEECEVLRSFTQKKKKIIIIIIIKLECPMTDQSEGA